MADAPARKTTTAAEVMIPREEISDFVILRQKLQIAAFRFVHGKSDDYNARTELEAAATAFGLAADKYGMYSRAHYDRLPTVPND